MGCTPKAGRSETPAGRSELVPNMSCGRHNVSGAVSEPGAAPGLETCWHTPCRGSTPWTGAPCPAHSGLVCAAQLEARHEGQLALTSIGEGMQGACMHSTAKVLTWLATIRDGVTHWSLNLGLQTAARVSSGLQLRGEDETDSTTSAHKSPRLTRSPWAHPAQSQIWLQRRAQHDCLVRHVHLRL